ncbi:hypothetical protein OROHE_000791 [Orobanche hederae]
MATSSVSLRLLIDTQAKKVLFAEARKDFVDFLFHILSLPIGTIIDLLREQEMVGSLENLYESIENLDDFKTLSKPVATGSCIPLLGIKPCAPTSNNLYKCICNSRDCSHVLDGQLVVCPHCGKRLDNKSSCPTRKRMKIKGKKKSNTEIVVRSDNKGGSAKGMVVTYMVTDDLAVTSMSANSSITLLLDKFNVKDVGILEEKVVRLGKAIKSCPDFSHYPETTLVGCITGAGLGHPPTLESRLAQVANGMAQVQKISVSQDAGRRAAPHIFTRVGFVIAKGVGAQIISRLPTNFLVYWRKRWSVWEWPRLGSC